MKRTVKMAISVRALIFAVLCALVALLVWPPQAAPQQKAGQSTAPSSTPPAPSSAVPSATPEAIPLPEIAARLEELNLLLREIAGQLVPDAEQTLIGEKLPSQEELIGDRQRETDELIASDPTLNELRELEQNWQESKKAHAAWRKKLADRAKTLEEKARLLASQETRWKATLNQKGGAKQIAAVSEQIRKALSDIRVARSQVNEELAIIVTMQSRVAQQDQIVLDMLAKINQARSQFHHGLLEADYRPLWEVGARSLVAPSLNTPLHRSFSLDVMRAWEYLKTRYRAVAAISALFLAVLILTFALRHTILRQDREHADSSLAVHFLQHPVLLALLAALIAALPLTPNAPTLLRALVNVLFMLPIVRFLPRLLHPAPRPLLYLLIVYGLTAVIWGMIGVSPAVKREVEAGVSLVAIVLLIWLLRPHRLRSLQSLGPQASLVIVIARAAFALILASSLLANVLGYVALSRVLRAGVIMSAYFGSILYTAVVATKAIASLLWQTRQAQLLSSFRTYGGRIAKWSSGLLNLTAFACWLSATLYYFAILETIRGALSTLLTTPLTLGAASFSLGDVLLFVLIFVLGLFFASAIRFILQADVLVRLPLAQGLPYAISTIIYYLLLLAGFLFALAAAGVELSRLTVLTGALGLGVGFGLQNIINNFASGIILLFERPIRIGDFLEVGTVMGEVKRIGMRSSSLGTPQGADVIVPNSNLISNQVTNWTLSGQPRRGELQIAVAGGTDPALVLKLLVETAEAHPMVLRAPSPLALFQGFGDNALLFELQFWVPQGQNHLLVKSELGMKVAAVLRDSGIEIAFPRREFYFRRTDELVDQDVRALAASVRRSGTATAPPSQREGGAQKELP